jgi:hypothetical protein
VGHGTTQVPYGNLCKVGLTSQASHVEAFGLMERVGHRSLIQVQKQRMNRWLNLTVKPGNPPPEKSGLGVRFSVFETAEKKGRNPGLFFSTHLIAIKRSSLKTKPALWAYFLDLHTDNYVSTGRRRDGTNYLKMPPAFSSSSA